MTSDMGGYGDPATQQTAARWAKRLRLNPAHVLAADLTGIKIPILFSPDGHVLFEKIGQMGAGEVRSTLNRYMQDWWAWKDSATLADWMIR